MLQGVAGINPKPLPSCHGIIRRLRQNQMKIEEVMHALIFRAGSSPKTVCVQEVDDTEMAIQKRLLVLFCALH